MSVTEEEMVAEKGMTFLEVLEKIEQSSDNTVNKGTQFERLIQRLLQTTPVYGCNDDRTKVYLWNEWSLSSPQRLNQLKARIQRFKRGNKRKRSGISERRMGSD